MLNHVFVSAPARRSSATALSVKLVVPMSSLDQKSSRLVFCMYAYLE